MGRWPKFAPSATDLNGQPVAPRPAPSSRRRGRRQASRGRTSAPVCVGRIVAHVGFQPVLLDPIAQALPAHAEQPGGLRYVATAALKGVFEHPPLDLLHAHGSIELEADPVVAVRPRLRWHGDGAELQPAGVQGIARRQKHAALDDVAKLPDVAGPDMRAQRGPSLIRHPRNGSLGALVELADEDLDQRLDVGRAFPQGGQTHLKDAQATVQIGTEPVCGNLLSQLPVGRPDQAHVHRDLTLAADAANALLLNGLQQLCLKA
jgi:hypothetical protein